ncbi:lysophospholipid acyltransferase family protein [Kribbella solani]|uniref:lysophospholipid acyltransferase family protein n=1 Tax=Kribbella solani TaxID=236067 RepID=UPI0029BC6DC8|nr:lysophospholipid acyltransferase family protein [Kribbella solani]MDX2972911.1 lysophospholipid acyltransferase family protein [Kribbella solani]MDX3001048.1 lysophospholipid acyltransferase family protein [Kribbella solani]
MADAEIIPIGTAGRPGRATGNRTTPSAAARNLAGSKKPRRTTTASTPAAPRGEGAESTTVPAGRKPVGGGAARPAEGVPRISAPAGDVQAGSAVGASGAGGGERVVGVEVGEPGVGVAEFERLARGVRELFGEDGERRVAEWVAFLRRRLVGEYEVDEFGFDTDLTDQVLLPMLRPLAEKWFRVEVRGVENIPGTGSALIVANHSGTMPLDGLITQLIVADHTGRPLRTLAADLVFKTPFVGELARKGGATLAGNDDAERLLRQGNLVGVWPEGFKGLGKPFSERYKLQRFGRGGFVSAAMRTRVPIVPCSIVGAEEIYPLVGNLASLARLVGVPYIPVTPFFPLLGPLGLVPLPSKWLIEFGEPIRTDDFPDGAADDPMLVFNVTDQVRETIQQTLYTLLMQRRSVFF